MEEQVADIAVETNKEPIDTHVDESTGVAETKKEPNVEMITICGKQFPIDTTDLDLSNMKLTAVPEEIKSFRNLYWLKLSDNNIETIDESSFEGLYNLHFLMLEKNKLKAIPKNAFKDLYNLHILYLSQNEIAHVDQDAFFNLASLKSLFLSGNKLESFENNTFIHMPHLELLNLNNNLLTLQNNVFEGLSNLKTLYLAMNKLTSISEYFFASLNNLTTLGLNFNNITSIEPLSFKNLGYLKNLTLYKNEDLVTLPDDMFENLVNLEYLDIMPTNLTSIPHSILNCTGLKYFCHDDKIVSDGVFEAVLKMVAQNNEAGSPRKQTEQTGNSEVESDN
uniref:Leucine-rich repeat protein n=1 Tax=viral metagenome TaxID=1070528 RepID=A0A6C0EBC4_9ZZZZ